MGVASEFRAAAGVHPRRPRGGPRLKLAKQSDVASAEDFCVQFHGMNVTLTVVEPGSVNQEAPLDSLSDLLAQGDASGKRAARCEGGGCILRRSVA